MFKSIACRAGIAARAHTAGASPRACRHTLAMPLRAKLPGQLAASSRNMSTNPENLTPDDYVIFQSKYGLRTIELNRPRKLNALDRTMIGMITPRLIEWEKSDMANVVVIKGAGDKAFCAGGDVLSLAKKNMEHEDAWRSSARFFAKEYQLNHCIATYGKPLIAFMDGITMGGGVGLSIHAPFRIATERTVFAMPETTIGLFPDVGASFFLPKLEGAVGTYLALTSDRIHGANAFYTGIATHYIHSTNLRGLEDRLAEIRFRDYEDLRTRLALVNDTIEEYVTGMPHDEPMHIQGELRKAIDRCFSFNSIEQIMGALERETGETKEWATNTLKSLHQRSPTSVHVTLKLMKSSAKWTIVEAFRRELALASRFMQKSDFNEGVMARLSPEKRTPNWSPATLEEVSKLGVDVTQPFFDFEAPEHDIQLKLLNEKDYDRYPYAYLGVPTEVEIMNAVLAHPEKGQEGVANEIINSRKGRQGISTVVWEIIQRKTKTEVNQEGKEVVRWID